MRRKVLWGMLACLVWSSAAIAQETGSLPAVTTLNCGKDCQSATDPKPADKHSASYPGFTPDNYPTEGMVLLRATITKEGTLRDAKVVRVVGAAIFAEKALEATKDWHYVPATRGGVAVDRPNWEIIVAFLYSPPIIGARDAVYSIFRQAVGLSNEGKYADAISLLEPVLTMPHLNFYERASVSLALALNYTHQGDTLTAREYIDDAVLLGDRFLAPTQRPSLWRLAAITSIKTGQLLEAKEAFAKLTALQTVTADDPLSKLIQTADARIRDDQILTAAGRISKIGGLPNWRHRLMRHSISIVQVNGKLDRITIECGEHLTESGVSDKAEWHIPKSWNACKLDVSGAPGTTFTLAEMND